LTQLSDEAVLAYVDGQLNERERGEFEREMAKDPALAERVEMQRWLARQVVAAFGPPPGDEIDQSLVARLGLGGPNVVAFPQRQQASKRGWLRPAAGLSALAASLVLGLFLGRTSDQPDALVATNGAGQVIAAGDLEQGLSNKLSGQPGAIRVAMTFRTEQGICRAFSTDTGLSGLGCRRDGQWVVPMLTGHGGVRQESGEYRLAAGAVAVPVLGEVDARIIGDPLEPKEEARLKVLGWR
jgi:hypothetical protein